MEKISKGDHYNKNEYNEALDRLYYKEYII
jgi:hypothetical protein